MIKPESDNQPKKESLRIIQFIPIEGKGRPEKIHYFKYKNEYIKEIQQKEAEKDNKIILKDEFKVISKVGFSKNAIDSIPNNSLLNVNFSQGKFN